MSPPITFIPDIEDRKAFLGCLAAVLASRYEYDFDVDTTNQNNNHNNNNNNKTRNEPSVINVIDDDNPSHVVITSTATSVTNTPLPPSSSSSTSMSSSSTSPHNPRTVRRGGSSISDKANMRKIRHRKRRYEVLSELLSSTEKLLFELNPDDSSTSNSSTNANTRNKYPTYLPMLEPILFVESCSISKSKEESPRRRIRSFDSKKGGNNDGLVDPFIRVDVLNEKIDEINSLRPFLECMKRGSAIRCLAIVLIEYLLLGGTGYDSRIRHSIKKLGVIIFMKECDDYMDHQTPVDVIQFATLKFEALERLVANKLLQLSASSPRGCTNNDTNLKANGKEMNRRKLIVNGLKIGAAAVAAGTIFAITAGMAAPAIAAGVAAVAGGTALTATAAALLTSQIAVSAIFGVGGGSLAAYKMSRRVVGLTEFVIRKENDDSNTNSTNNKSNNNHTDSNNTFNNNDNNKNNFDGTNQTANRDLFMTVCISGWYSDDIDFQRPWGVTPTNPPIRDKLELLERFFAIHDPTKIDTCSKILKEYNYNWVKLCSLLKKVYGRDPDHLFPLDDGPKLQSTLTKEQENVLENLFFELGCSSSLPPPLQPPPTIVYNTTSNTTTNNNIQSHNLIVPQPDPITSDRWEDAFRVPLPPPPVQTPVVPVNPIDDSFSSESSMLLKNPLVDDTDKQLDTEKSIDHLSTVWDYQTTYGGELYTIRWESKLIKQISDSITALALQFIGSSATEFLKFTILSTLMAALSVPSMLAAATSLIDGPWSLAASRADEAGKELARSLLISNGGNRPVTLIGFSFGARVVYSCLKELARQQEIWEECRVSNTVATKILIKNDIKRTRSSDSLSENDSEYFEMIREPASIVEDAIILGMPERLERSSWETCRQMVAGRLINGFTQKDWVLALMYKLQQVGIKPVCGISPVNVPGVENVDLTDLIHGHQDYLYKIGPILKRVRHCQPFPLDPLSSSSQVLLVDNAAMAATTISSS